VGLTQRQANRQSDSHTPMESRRLAPPTVFGLQGSLCGFYAGLTALRHAGEHNNASNLAFTMADRPNPGGGAQRVRRLRLGHVGNRRPTLIYGGRRITLTTVMDV
jgi:hypothetical protein